MFSVYCGGKRRWVFLSRLFIWFLRALTTWRIERRWAKSLQNNQGLVIRWMAWRLDIVLWQKISSTCWRDSARRRTYSELTQIFVITWVYFFPLRKSITPSVLEGRDEHFLESRGTGGQMKHIFEIPLGTGAGKTLSDLQNPLIKGSNVI